MRILSILVLWMLTLSATAQDSSSYWVDKGVDFAVGAGASYVGNKMANGDNKQPSQQPPAQTMIRVDGLSVICKWLDDRSTKVGCWDDETHTHMQPAVFLRKHGGVNARFVRMFYMSDYAIIQYVLVNEVKK